MSGGRKFFLPVLLIGLTVGCAAPTVQNLQVAEQGREEAGRLLSAFGEAVRQDSPHLVEPLLAPTLSRGKAREILNCTEAVVWLRRYTGYKIDAEAVLRGVGWRKWESGAFWVKVPCTNSMGRRFKDRFALARVDGQWSIYDLELTGPRSGDALDPPEEVRKQLWPKIQVILDNMREGHISEIFYELPEEDACRKRSPKLSWWRRLLRLSPGSQGIYDDLERLEEFLISDWPLAEEVYGLAYVPTRGIMAVYQVPYVWPEGGIREADILRIQIVFMKSGETWTFYTLRLSGKGIPYS